MLGSMQFVDQHGCYYYCFFSILLPLIFLHVLFKWFFKSPNNTQKNLPPSPPKLPIIGNLHQLGSSAPHRSLHSLSRQHGPLMSLRLGSIPVLVASSAAAARDILKTHDLLFSDRPRLSIPAQLLYNCRDVSAAPYGEYWRQVRSISVLHLLSNRRVEGFRAVRHEETSLLVKKIKHLAATAPALVDLSEMLMGVTNDVVCRVALGRKYREGRFREMLGEFVELLGAFTVGDFVPWLSWVNRLNRLNERVEKTFRDFDCFLDAVVEEHISRRNGDRDRGGEEQKDFVDVLLEIQRDNAAGFPIERDTIKALILDMFAAGTDTSFTVLEWAMSELLRQPHIMKKLQAELRGIVRNKSSSFLTEDELHQLPYLKAVIKETLRVHTPIPLLVPRKSTRDVKLQGYDIPAGTMTLINAWAIGRETASWGEDADRFRPERFLNSSVDFRGRDFQLLPFGGGRRGCPGIEFAMATDELVLANLVREFDWELPGGVEGENLDMSESVGLTIHRKSPLIASATPHSWREP